MKNSAKTRLLLLSGGCLVGQNILDALSDRRHRIELIATNSAAESSCLFDYDAVYLTPPTLAPGRDFEHCLLDILQREQPDLVIPCRDDDVVFLAELGARRPELAARFLCGNLETARIANDKWLSRQFCVAHGLPFAPTLPTPAEDAALDSFAAEHGLPLLVKPRDGFGAKDIRLIANPEQLRRAAVREGYVIQPYLNDAEVLHGYLRDAEAFGAPLFHSFEAPKHSIQLLIAPDGSLAGNFASCNINRFGTSLRLEHYAGADAVRLGEACGLAFAQTGWRGPMNIQCRKMPDGRLLIYEFNSRLSGATAARYRMGHDELGLVLQHFAGWPEPGGLVEGRGELVIRRAVDVAIERECAEALARDPYWRRPAELECPEAAL